MDKIKKLLALGESPNEHEAALALKRAQQLLDKHNLTKTDIEQTVIKEIRITMGKHCGEDWVSALMKSICNEFCCFPLIDGGGGTENKYILAGEKDDLEIAEYTIHYLYRVVMKMARDYGSTLHPADNFTHPKISYVQWKRNCKKAYKMGMVTKLNAKLEGMRTQRFKNDSKGASGKTGKEMVHIKDGLVKNFIRQKYNPNVKNFRKSTLDSASYHRGMVDGDKVAVHRGVGGGGAQLRLGGK